MTYKEIITIIFILTNTISAYTTSQNTKPLTCNVIEHNNLVLYNVTEPAYVIEVQETKSKLESSQCVERCCSHEGDDGERCNAVFYYIATDSYVCSLLNCNPFDNCLWENQEGYYAAKIIRVEEEDGSTRKHFFKNSRKNDDGEEDDEEKMSDDYKDKMKKEDDEDGNKNDKINNDEDGGGNNDSENDEYDGNALSKTTPYATKADIVSYETNDRNNYEDNTFTNDEVDKEEEEASGENEEDDEDLGLTAQNTFENLTTSFGDDLAKTSHQTAVTDGLEDEEGGFMGNSYGDLGDEMKSELDGFGDGAIGGNDGVEEDSGVDDNGVDGDMGEVSSDSYGVGEGFGYGSGEGEIMPDGGAESRGSFETGNNENKLYAALGVMSFLLVVVLLLLCKQKWKKKKTSRRIFRDITSPINKTSSDIIF